jgi:nucleoside-diphosphate-sugar epimerase
MVHKGTKRAWCFVSDFITGLYLASHKSFSGKYEAFNIGSDEYLTMEEVARIVVEECGRDRSLIKVVAPPAKFLSLSKNFSIQKIKSLGYEPKIPLREGIRRVIEWQRKEALPKRG